jgi:cytochrome c biogenesis protein CcmG/thiol:disulfide interchange protein DsbE
MRRFALPALATVLALALVGLLAFGLTRTGDDTSLEQALAEGRHPRAHDAALPLLDGGTRRLADLRGKVVVVNFFAHWCPPCKREAPLLARTQRAIAKRDATFLGVAWDDTTDDVRAFVDVYGVNYPVVSDVDGSFARAYGVRGMPESFVIDQRGRIVALRRGALDERWIERYVDPLLAPRAS